MRDSIIALGALLAIAACSEKVSLEPVPVFPDAEAPTQFTRAYSMTESRDGQVRVFAKEKGDYTHLYVTRREGKGWSEPEQLDLPGRKIMMGPSFSAEDGNLYFATDAVLPEPTGQKDLNIWMAPYADGTFGEACPIEGDINTGANETGVAISADGLMVFASNHSRNGRGGYDLAEARRDESGAWHMIRALEELNDPQANDHIALSADGQTLYFYSHRKPKLGVVDIWVSRRQPDGTWRAPENPGEPLNTPGVDYGAGLSADGKTLFFSRDGALYEMPVSALESAGD